MSDIPQDHVRLFVACEVPDAVKEAIGETIEGLRKKSGPAVRWIKPEGVHVTLKFLGEVPVRKLPAVKLAIQEAVVGHSPFELEFSNIGTFGGREGLRLMWVGIAGDVLRLEALVRSMNAALAVVGFEPERRPPAPRPAGPRPAKCSRRPRSGCRSPLPASPGRARRIARLPAPHPYRIF